MKQHRFDKTFQNIIEAVNDVCTEEVITEGVNADSYWVEDRILGVPYKGQIKVGSKYSSHVTAKDKTSVSVAFAKLMSSIGFKTQHYKILTIMDKDSEEYEKSLLPKNPELK